MNDQKIKSKFERLSKLVVPRHYDVVIQSYLDQFKFDGDVSIDIEIKESIDQIVIYSVDLEIQSVTLKSELSSEICTVYHDSANEVIRIKTDTLFNEGRYQLVLKYTGKINNFMHGFYRTKHIRSDGTIYYGASTQFEPTDCRRAFPCWDEPNFKATFDITLIVPNNLLAISNMPIKSETTYTDNAYKIVKFDRTPVMSTYLVAYVIGEYDYVETKDSNNIDLRVYTPVGKSSQGIFALDVATKVLPFYAEYFGIKYILPKLDQIAIPDFAMGAMENWGLLTYREIALLVDEKHSPVTRRQCVAVTVAHEIAHQWFGNLVTMDWWTDLWLNEGFATWIEYLAVDRCYPEFDIWTQFVSDTFCQFLISDALKSSHPIEVPINHPSEIDEIFDDISYLKGASVIRMLHDYIGDDDFRSGLHNYLTQYSYRNTTTKDLWRCLSDISNKPVDVVMSSWIHQTGYPFVTVEEEHIDNTRILRLKQQRFIANGDIDNEQPSWKIPITVFTNSDPTKVIRILMDKPTIEITIDNISKDDWIKLNFHSIGLYRVKYQQQTLDRLSNPILQKLITPQDRLMIQDDLLALCSARHQSLVHYLKLLVSYKDEDNFTVWKSIALNISDISSIFEYTDFFDSFKNYCLDIVSIIYNKVGWDSKEGEDSSITMLRPVILIIAGKSNHQNAILEARKRFEKHIEGELIDPNIRLAVYSIVSYHGAADIQKKLHELYAKADINEEQVRLLRAMGQSNEKEFIEDTLNFILTDNVRIQDAVSGVFGCITTATGRELVWKFVKEKWEIIVTRFGEKSVLLIHLVECLSYFIDKQIADEIKGFFNTKNILVIDRAIKKTVETINMRSNALEYSIESVRKHLIEQY